MAYKLGPTDKKRETTAFLESRSAKASSTNEITLNAVLKPVSPIEVTHAQSISNLGPQLTSIKVTCVKGHLLLFLLQTFNSSFREIRFLAHSTYATVTWDQCLDPTM